MSREIALRVPSEIGAWVRQQSASATETVLALAGDLYRRRQHVALRDPGPGDDRLKVHLEPRVRRFVNAATHSRDATAAVRKLLLWGAEGRAFPAAPSRASRQARRSSRSSHSIAEWPSGLVIAMAIASAAGGYAQSKATAAACEGLARNPGARSGIQFALILALVLIQSMALYTFAIIFAKVT